LHLKDSQKIPQEQFVPDKVPKAIGHFQFHPSGP
jgi:hypothetical protein